MMEWKDEELRWKEFLSSHQCRQILQGLISEGCQIIGATSSPKEYVLRFRRPTKGAME
jgi:hypothetical protein